MPKKKPKKRAHVPLVGDIDPKIDPAFKEVVGVKELLLGFLNDLFSYLGLPEALDLTYKSIELAAHGYFGKGGRLDVFVELKGRSKIAVEMQVQDHLDMPNRLQFYAGKLFVQQFKRGHSHADDEILPVLVIGILAFEFKPRLNIEMINHFTFYDKTTRVELPDPKIGIVTIELPKLDAFFAKYGPSSGLGYWSAFFRDTEKDKNLVQEYKFTMKARKILEEKRLEDDFAESYRQAIEILNDEESVLKTYSYNRYKLGKLEGMQEGIEKGRSEGIEKGRSEGIEKGRSEGIEKGRSEGIEKGRSEGIEKGRSEGIEKGRSEGIEKGKAELRLMLANKLKAKGLSQKEISDLLDLQSIE